MLKQILKQLGKVRGMPFQIVLKKVVGKGKEKLYYAVREKWVSRRPVDMPEKYFIDYQPNLDFLFDLQAKEMYMQTLRKWDQEQAIIDQAERICRHVFALLGSGEQELGKKIQWNLDFKTGFTWRNDFYKSIHIIDLSNQADVKVPWELSRFQHLPTLGIAYLLTSDPRYAQEFGEEIADWIEQNPVEMSVNWACTMDVAIRACNWIVGYYFFKDSPVISEAVWSEFQKNLYLHGRFIMSNLENRGRVTNNHYLSNIVALIWLGLYFRGSSSSPIAGTAQRWLEFGLRELDREMQLQVNEDGTDFEASTAYHCMVTEFFLYTTMLCERNGITFSSAYLLRLQKMIDFIAAMIKPNGRIPLIGDMDSGRFLIISQYGRMDKRDFRHLLAIAGERFEQDQYRLLGKDAVAEAVWFDLPKEAAGPAAISSKAFERGGFYFLCNPTFHTSIRCGENSMRGHGGHGHNDQLSFELNVLGEDIFIDPGNFVYTADYRMRNRFRSTENHNTLQVERLEQNHFDEMVLFAMNDDTKAETIYFDGIRFRGRHYGYQAKCGIIHDREITLGDQDLQICDTLIGEDDRSFVCYLRFHVAEGVSIFKQQDSIFLQKEAVRIELCVIGEKDFIIEPYWFSPEYGIKREARRITYQIQRRNVIQTVLSVK